MRRPSPLFISNSNFLWPIDFLALAHIFHNIDTTKSNFRAILFL
nr:MAG TPA: hypothetical protein [Caudoviricetes sp.]